MSITEASCPHCGAEYQLTPEQLAAANGQVRCGACMQVFQVHTSAPEPPIIDDTEQSMIGDTEQMLIDDDMDMFAAEAADNGDDPEADSSEQLNEELLSLDSAIQKSGEGNFFADDEVDVIADEVLDEVDESWADELLDEAEAMPDLVKPIDDPNNIDEFSDALLLDNADADAELDKSGLLGRITPEPLELETRRDFSTLASMAWTLLLLCLLASLITQTLYFKRDDWSRHPELRSGYLQMCEWLQCELPPQFDINDISASNTHQKNHAVYNNALVVETVITNHATIRQPFPNIELMFRDQNKRVIAARQFTPDEYLRGQIASSKTMPKRQPIRVAIELDDPGAAATEYELLLSY